MHPGHLFRSIGALGMAARQVVQAGTPEQLAKVVAIVDNARRDVYRLLADEPTDTRLTPFRSNRWVFWGPFRPQNTHRSFSVVGRSVLRQ